jgi:hypothetical protein
MSLLLEDTFVTAFLSKFTSFVAPMKIDWKYVLSTICDYYSSHAFYSTVGDFMSVPSQYDS